VNLSDSEMLRFYGDIMTILTQAHGAAARGRANPMTDAGWLP